MSFLFLIQLPNKRLLTLIPERYVTTAISKSNDLSFTADAFGKLPPIKWGKNALMGGGEDF